MTFFGKSNSLFGKFSPKFAKVHSLIPPFFSSKNSFPKSIKKDPEKKDIERYSESSRTSKMEHFADIS